MNQIEHLLFKDEVFTIIGAAMDVYNELGNGFLESVYQEAMQVELASRKIPFRSQVLVPVYYKGKTLPKDFFVDILAYDAIIIELKAIKQLAHNEEAQLINYLKASKNSMGLLINFGSVGKMEWKRFILTESD